MSIHGIHHITAIASDAQATHCFYTNVLGLRLVKKTVNQDDTATYHLFFGDKTGSPGMDLTFFIFLPPHQGRQDVGQVTLVSFAVPASSLNFWHERLTKENVKTEQIETRFDRERFVFFDPDNMRLELVGVPDEELEKLSSKDQIWTTKDISKKQAIRSFYSARLGVAYADSLLPVLETLGYASQGFEESVNLFHLSNATDATARAATLELETMPTQNDGVNAAGTVHHIAFEVPDDEALLATREKILKLALYPTGIIDRFYFHSVYFRTRAGILFELATSGPGFAADEDENTLGEKLALPPFLEPQREAIEKNLIPLELETP